MGELDEGVETAAPNFVSVEVSADGAKWTPVADLEPSSMGFGAGIVGGLVGVDGRGPWQVRARVGTDAGEGVSEPVTIEVNQEPVAAFTASIYGGGDTLFDGTSSTDADGTIVSWDWDFGDGSTGTGPAPFHFYLSPPDGLTVTLSVTDDEGGVGTSAWVAQVPRGGFGPITFTLAPFCLCFGMQVRGDPEDLPAESEAWGRDSAPGGAAWPAFRPRMRPNDDSSRIGMDDGVTLGPLDVNPGNDDIGGGDKAFSGYGFEIVADVFGDPALCDEAQLVRSTGTLAGASAAVCERGGGQIDPATGLCVIDVFRYETMTDLDGDDVVDRDVSTPALCTAAGGAWVTTKNGERCRLHYPADGDEWTIDMYEEPYDWKIHDGTRIAWFDSPACYPWADTATYEGEFIAWVRGTDGHYCYAEFTVTSTRNVGAPDVESMSVQSETVGATSLPL